MAKIKVKTKSAMKKRYKVTGSGKIVRYRRSHTGHNSGFKSNTKMRRLQKQTELTKTLLKQTERAMGRA
ncbi:hypothetical protein OSSY52_04830 [Tepiditoga spiralis]|uniref:50S ribosomal protein L35 n=1 Tax=Tepiditoga spiralis TaxID=2108365 RepID=A0A7G1G8H9_9BACT|nr:50S ribosomal protein L35 [Tepiditoga spiralis]BBE30342.1 hypothetical protein OSSY52_04830 [Tepiditoga spiralis]